MFPDKVITTSLNHVKLIAKGVSDGETFRPPNARMDLEGFHKFDELISYYGYVWDADTMSYLLQKDKTRHNNVAAVVAPDTNIKTIFQTDFYVPDKIDLDKMLSELFKMKNKDEVFSITVVTGEITVPSIIKNAYPSARIFVLAETDMEYDHLKRQGFYPIKAHLNEILGLNTDIIFATPSLRLRDGGFAVYSALDRAARGWTNDCTIISTISERALNTKDRFSNTIRHNIKNDMGVIRRFQNKKCGTWTDPYDGFVFVKNITKKRSSHRKEFYE